MVDPEGELTGPQLLEQLEPHMLEYRALVIMDRVEPGMNVEKALQIYKKWYLLTRAPSWGAIRISRTINGGPGLCRISRPALGYASRGLGKAG